MLKEVCKTVEESGMASIKLHVSEANSTAINMYKKNGFKIVDRDDSGYFMKKDLLE